MKNVREQTAAELDWNLKDLLEVIAICETENRKPNGMRNPKYGHYMDELHAVSGERRRRTTQPHVCPTCGRG